MPNLPVKLSHQREGGYNRIVVQNHFHLAHHQAMLTSNLFPQAQLNKQTHSKQFGGDHFLLPDFLTDTTSCLTHRGGPGAADPCYEPAQSRLNSSNDPSNPTFQAKIGEHLKAASKAPSQPLPKMHAARAASLEPQLHISTSEHHHTACPQWALQQSASPSPPENPSRCLSHDHTALPMTQAHTRHVQSIAGITLLSQEMQLLPKAALGGAQDQSSSWAIIQPI